MIRQNQFDQNPRLLSLTMANNLIENFHVNTFVSNVNLEVLDFGNNQITSLPGTLLRANGRLVSLGMRRNGITAIQNNFFNNLPNLRFINLQTNECVNQFFSNNRGFAVDVAPFLDSCFRNFSLL